MKSPCYTLLWAPNNSALAQNIVQNIMASNMPAIPANRVRGFASVEAANAWMQDGNDQRVMGVYDFIIDPAMESLDFGLQIVRLRTAHPLLRCPRADATSSPHRRTAP